LYFILEEYLKKYLPSEQVPDHTTLYYCFKKFPTEKNRKDNKANSKANNKKVGK